MLRGSGIRVPGKYTGPTCVGVSHIWVNGKRIVLPPPPTELALARARSATLRSRFTYDVLSVLSEIEPEHIAEITYHDCFDTSLAAVGANNAIFVTLKPGVGYSPGLGSFADSER